jgi:drug/metabolite transporter (DMT)-like permease
LIRFAANSLLTRAAVGRGLLDAATFTTVRLASGAAMLWLITRLRPAPSPDRPQGWMPAAALAVYMAAFSFAYTRVDAAAGALLLFGAVQLTMMGWGLRGGVRPHWWDWAGATIAFAGLAALVAPGLTAPDPSGAALMAVAGVAWGVYSLLGRHVAEPLPATAAAFVRAVPAGLAMSLATRHAAHVSSTGIVLAFLSGALASGVGYTLWYFALPALSAWRAAVLQLLVPALTAAGAVLLLGEAVTLRLAAAGAAIAAGVALPLARAVSIRRGR